MPAYRLGRQKSSAKRLSAAWPWVLDQWMKNGSFSSSGRWLQVLRGRLTVSCTDLDTDINAVSW